MLIGPFIRLLRIALREKPARFKPPARYHVTLDMRKVRPGETEMDTNEWLMKIGFRPTARANVWKANEGQLRRVPEESVLKAEKL